MRRHLLIFCLFLSSQVGCAQIGSHYAGMSEDETADLLARATRDLDADRRDELVRPGRADGETGDAPIPEDLPDVLELEDALRLATERNRRYVREFESLEIVAMSLLGTRNVFGPRFNSVLAYTFGQDDHRNISRDGSARFGVTQILPTGGDLSIDLETDISKDPTQHPLAHRFSSSVNAQLNQPLLRGAWNGARHESLTQAERSLVYAVRDFELFRQGFTIDITADFFDLTRRKQVIANNRLNLEQSRTSFRRAEKFFEVGRMSGIDKFRAEQEFLQAESRLLESVEEYALELDRFKIQLGLPTSVEIDVRGAPGDVVSVDVGLRSAVAAAIANRLDLDSARERVEDSRRRVAIARQDLLPDLDLTLSHSSTWFQSRSFADQKFNDSNYAAGLSLTLPLDRVNERHDYREAMIALARAERDSSQAEDEVVLDVRNALRRLARIESSLVIEEKSLQSNEKRFRISQIRLQEGKIGNREVVEAQLLLLNSRNAIAGLKVDHEVARLRLRQTLGTLFLDENGVPLR
jgi:outer membrane protein TolC